jgi:hypothetical protein
MKIQHLLRDSGSMVIVFVFGFVCLALILATVLINGSDKKKNNIRPFLNPSEYISCHYLILSCMLLLSCLVLNYVSNSK